MSPCGAWRSRYRPRASAWRASGADGSQDPICGLPLTEDTAEEIAHDVRGSHGAVLLAGLRRYLAPAPGALALPAELIPDRRTTYLGASLGLPSSLLNIGCESADRGGATRGTEEPGMRQLPALDMSSNVTKFWRSYVYIGVLTYSLGAFAVLIYSLTTTGPAPGGHGRS